MERRSFKWLSAKTDDGYKLQVENIEEAVFNQLGRSFFGKDHHVNLVSVFGKAREGKSFLLNCLMGEDFIFRISNSAAPCTAGIDITNNWMTLNSFSKIDGGHEITENGLRIGFVDAEGQGDKAVEHDARVCCPVLLTSKCVIFNWKGGVQKDDILNKLAIMTRAAASVGVDTNAAGTTGDTVSSNTGSKQFGHLHIVFRDWNSEESDPLAIYDVLFAQERGQDEEAGAYRNHIRTQMLAAFESIRVWLFTAPNENSKILRKEMVIADLSDEFRQQLREFRDCISLQLVEPKLFANMPLTGKSLQRLMQSVVSSLNNGHAVIPSGAYQSMLAGELNHAVAAMEKEMRSFVTTYVAELNSTAGSEEFAKSYLPTEDDALLAAVAGLQCIEVRHDDIVRTTICDEESEVGKQLLVSAAYHATVASNRELLNSFFVISYREMFRKWVTRLHGELVRQLEDKTTELLRVIDTENVEGKSVDSIDKDLAEVISSLKLLAGGDKYNDQSDNDVKHLLLEVERTANGSKRDLLVQRFNEKVADAEAMRIAREIREKELEATAQAAIIAHSGCCF